MFTLTPSTEIQIQMGVQSGAKRWDKIAFEYIGSKSSDLARVQSEIEAQGHSEWQGFGLFHPEFGK